MDIGAERGNGVGKDGRIGSDSRGGRGAARHPSLRPHTIINIDGRAVDAIHDGRKGVKFEEVEEDNPDTHAHTTKARKKERGRDLARQVDKGRGKKEAEK